jgi:NCAIR mutase (PurE)-related protein
MESNQIRELTEQLLGGKLPLEQFLAQLVKPRTADLGEVQLDLDRQRRCGFPEVIFGEGKSLLVLEKLIARMLEEGIDVLATRISPEVAVALVRQFPAARYNEVGRTLRIAPTQTNSPILNSEISNLKSKTSAVAIVTAGTADLSVAEEARETLLWMGVEPTLVQDVGVAGPHRLTERLHLLQNVDAVIVVAGMEGALPSVVGGYVACPVIAVPTSVGYGASCGGLAALLTMLNSCAANVTVVNVDAGFKAGYVAGLIAHRAAKQHPPDSRPEFTRRGGTPDSQPELARRGGTSNL